MNTCSDCTHFSALHKQCRAKPPAAALVPGPDGRMQVIGFFPSVAADNWCGELRLPHQVPLSVIRSKANE